MTMHYVAAEPGTHELPDGTRVLVDSVSLTNQKGSYGVPGSNSYLWETYDNWPGSTGGGGSSGPLPASQLFGYDANGNRTSLTEDTVLYPYTNLLSSNRILSAAGPVAKTYGYDPSGNVTSDGVHVYGYDDRGRLVNVDSGSVTYVHNGQGQRVRKDDGSITLFAYDEAGNLIGEYDSTGAALKEHVWFDGAPVAVVEGTNVHYVHTDHLGTPRAISDGNTVIWRWSSDAFGSTPADEDADGNSSAFSYNLRFPGQYFDAETGLHYNYFRTYDPSTGRYLESDPIGLVAGLNTYGYAGANPVGFVDRWGLDYYPPGSYGHGSIEFLDENAKIDAWIADLPGSDIDDPNDDTVDRDVGCQIPENADLDFILVDGVWYKIKNGKAFIKSDGEGNSKVLPCQNCSPFVTEVYPVDKPPIHWRALDGNSPQKYINRQSQKYEERRGEPLPNTPVPIPPWPGLRNLP